MGVPCLLGTDPSFRASGWAVVRADRRVLAMGVIRTASRKSKQLKARMDGDDGLLIFHCMSWVISQYQPTGPVCQEANGGSKSVRAASCLARAQQACLCATDRAGLGTLLLSPAALKRDVAWPGADKDDVKAEVRKFFTGDWDRLASQIHEYPGVRRQKKPTPVSLHDNMYDSLGALQAHWTHPAIQAIHHE